MALSSSTSICFVYLFFIFLLLSFDIHCIALMHNDLNWQLFRFSLSRNLKWIKLNLSNQISIIDTIDGIVLTNMTTAFLCQFPSTNIDLLAIIILAAAFEWCVQLDGKFVLSSAVWQIWMHLESSLLMASLHVIL